jgi:pimeloyl-ACP methyl ester carboxylesterase
MAHGLLGFKDWGFFPYLADCFAKAGFPAVRFNFSGSGMGSNQDGPFTDLAGFENDTITRQVEDLHAVLSAVRAGRIPGCAPSQKAFLWGHSRGGGVALLTAVRDPAVAAVAAWAPISRVMRYPYETVQEWRRQGYRVFESSRTGQSLKCSSAFLEDTERWARQGDLPVQVHQLTIPALLLHGASDPTVKPEESESLAAVCPTARLVVLSGADHKFGCSHPFMSPGDILREAARLTVGFFKGHLS